MNSSVVLQLFKNSSKVYVYRTIGNASKVFFIEFSKTTIDATWANGINYKPFFADDEAFKVFALFTVNIAAKYTSEQIAKIFIDWSKYDMKYLFDSFDPERKVLAEQIDAIVKTEGFKKLVNLPIASLKQFINDVINSQFSVTINKLQTIDTNQSFEDFIIKNEKIPVDITRVELNQYIIEIK